MRFRIGRYLKSLIGLFATRHLGIGFVTSLAAKRDAHLAAVDEDVVFYCNGLVLILLLLFKTLPRVALQVINYYFISLLIWTGIRLQITVEDDFRILYSRDAAHNYLRSSPSWWMDGWQSLRWELPLLLMMMVIIIIIIIRSWMFGEEILVVHMWRRASLYHTQSVIRIPSVRLLGYIIHTPNHPPHPHDDNALMRFPSPSKAPLWL